MAPGESIKLSHRVSHIKSWQNENYLSSATQVQEEEVSDGSKDKVDLVVHFDLTVHV